LHVFYSWQSDIKGAACRTLIQTALESAAERMAQQGVVEIEPRIDSDTQGVAGAPDIGLTILAKIDAADAFVADVTIVGATVDGKAMPNPNVLIELGYALKSLGPARIVLVQNTAFGGPERLPFDLRQKRVLKYESAEHAPERAQARKHLQAAFETALGAIVTTPRPDKQPVTVTIGYTKDYASSDGNVHHYRLDVCVTNISSKRIDDWEIDVVCPTEVLETNVFIPERVAARSNAESTLFRVDGKEVGARPIRPGDEKRVGWRYFMNDALYSRRNKLFEQLVTVRVLVNGEIAAEAQRPFRELQNF
jgi:hypothetical protein